jgi:photosystem II oxygen-evolving enhancer protein 1
MKIHGDYDKSNAKRDALTKRLWEERQQMKRGTSPVLGGDVGTATIQETQTMPKPYDFKIEQRFAAAAAATMLLVGVANPLPALATGGDNPNSVTSDVRTSRTYDEVKGTGLANRCNIVQTPRNDPSTGQAGDRETTITVKSGSKLVDFCLEPKQFFVEEEIATKKGTVESKYVPTKLMTRQTYTLDGITGTYSQENGKLQFKEEDGIDYAPTTVQMPGGERVPFLFTVKELLAVGAKEGYDVKPGYDFGGKFSVPSYRSGLFLDPKGRGMTTGYDMAQALTGLQTGNDGDARLENENNKKFDNLQGSVEFQVQSVNAEFGEFGGVFVSTQPGDTDQGTQKPKKILLKGVFFGKIEPEGSVNR